MSKYLKALSLCIGLAIIPFIFAHHVYAVDCDSGTNPWLNARAIDPNKIGGTGPFQPGSRLCFIEPSGSGLAQVWECDGSTGIFNPVKDTSGPNGIITCMYNDAVKQCVESGTPTHPTASCNVPTPTPIPVSTGTPVPCPPIKTGAILVPGCSAKQDIQVKPSSSKCIQNVAARCLPNGVWNFENCTKPNNAGGKCATNDSGQAFCTLEVGGEPPDACAATATDTGSDACGLAPPPGQQSLPRPGVNCGITDGEPLPEGATGNAYACCYSATADSEIVPLSCFVDLPGADSIIRNISGKLNQVINKAPNINRMFDKNEVTVDPNMMTIGGVREALKQIPPCADAAITPSGKSPGDTSFDPTKADTGCRCYSLPKSSLGWYCGQIVANTDEGKAEQKQCLDCVTKPLLDGSGHQVKDFNGKPVIIAGDGVWTALGCINIADEGGFVQQMLNLGVILGAAFSVLCNIYAAFLYQTSMGSPENLNKARSLILSCITGLLLMIFSIFILNLIGYKILRLPGLG